MHSTNINNFVYASNKSRYIDLAQCVYPLWLVRIGTNTIIFMLISWLSTLLNHGTTKNKSKQKPPCIQPHCGPMMMLFTEPLSRSRWAIEMSNYAHETAKEVYPWLIAEQLHHSHCGRSLKLSCAPCGGMAVTALPRPQCSGLSLLGTLDALQGRGEVRMMWGWSSMASRRS